MTTTSRIPLAILAVLSQANGLPANLERIERKEKTIDTMIDDAVAKFGGCVFVMPVKPLRVTEGDFIFVEKGEVRVRLVVNPSTSDIDMETGEMAAQIRLALQGTNPDGLLADNLRLANPPVEEIEDPQCVVIDLIFTAAYEEAQ